MANYSDKLLVLDAGQLKKISSSDTVEITGTLTATTITGGGAGVTGLNADNLASGTIPNARFPATLPAISGANLTNLDADDLASGTIPNARFPATLPAISGANLTNLDADDLASGTIPDARFPAILPAISGANLTNLDASDLATGTVADARLSANVPLLNAANSFSAAQTMTGLTVSGDAGITGNLTVSGDIISQGQVNVLVSDSFLDLASGNVGSSALPGGFTVNVKKATAFVAETVTDFAAGSTSGPTFTVSGGSTALAAGDIVQISGASPASNNGLFVVDSVAAGVVTVKGTGGSSLSPNTPFAQSQFTTATSQSATAVKVDLAAFAVSGGSLTKSGGGSIAAGTFCYNYQAGATESSFSSSWVEITTASTPSLQSVYGVSGAVTLVGGNNLAISKPTSGNAAVSLEANSASKFEVTGAGLTLSTLTSGNVAVTSADDVVVTAGAGDKIQMASEVQFDQEAGALISTATGIAAGDIVYIDGTGVCQKADNNGSGTLEVDGVCVVANSSGSAADRLIATVDGAPVLVNFVEASPAAGAIAYLSAIAGQATTTLPTSGRLFRIGKVKATGSSNQAIVILRPQYIADI